MLEKRNPALYSALKALTVDAFELLKLLFPNGENAPMISEFKWMRQGEGDAFFRQLAYRSQYWILIYQSMPMIRGRDSYVRAKALVEADPIWSLHIDKLVGSPMGARRMDVDDILMRPSTSFLREKSDFEFSETDFNKAVSEFECFATSSTIELVQITPFYGMVVQEKIPLSAEVSIEAIDDETLKQCLDIGIVPGTFSSAAGDSIVNPPRAAVFTRVLMPKMIRGDNDAIGHPLSNPWTKHIATESKALELLTLIFGTPMTPVGSLIQATGVVNSGLQYHQRAIPNPWSLTNVRLTDEHNERFRQYWPIINEESRKSRHFLAIGLRRFALAMSRPLPDDKLIDLMICAEALFLKIDKNELTFRLALNAALLLSDDSKQRKVIFKFFKDAYSMRSSLVHGSKSYLDNAEDLDKLNRTVNQLAEHLRMAILKMLERARDPHAPVEIIDWTSLIFSETSDESESGTAASDASSRIRYLTSPH